MKTPLLQYNNFGTRHLPRLNPVRKAFGLRWRSCFPPVSWVINALAAVAASLIVLLLMGMLAARDESVLAAAQALVSPNDEVQQTGSAED